MREKNGITFGINLTEMNRELTHELLPLSGSKLGTYEQKANSLITESTDSSSQRENSERS